MSTDYKADTIKEIGSKIADIELGIQGIKLQPDNPFTWASGAKMPIYNDNRTLLSSYKARKLTTEGFSRLTEKHGVNYDGIIGTSTSGIAPAASFAKEHGVPLIIFEGGKPYMFQTDNFDFNKKDSKDYNFDNGVLNRSTHFYHDFDAIATTCPWAIPAGVELANKLEKPFAYARPTKKGHGLKKQVEGILNSGQEVFLIDFHMGESYIKGAAKSIIYELDENGDILLDETFNPVKTGINIRSHFSRDISSILKPADIKGMNLFVGEDLISTGGSSADQVQLGRDFGANVDYCFSIFTYGFEKADKKFAALEGGCKTDSILDYGTLVEVVKDKKVIKNGKEEPYFDKKQVAAIADWEKDPWGWAKRHGFE